MSQTLTQSGLLLDPALPAPAHASEIGATAPVRSGGWLWRWFSENFKRKHGFARGVHPDAHKGTAGKPIRRLPYAPRLSLPLAQHIGKPAVPLVCVGEEVVRGQPIASADGFMSVPLHAPVTGRVEAIELRPSATGAWVESIVIHAHEGSTQEVLWREPRDMDSLTPRQILEAIQGTGMVGLGGAAFPSHVKLNLPPGRKVHTLVVNGCECEPYLTCDHRTMVEHPADLMRGIRYAMRTIGASRAIIGVENNKLEALDALEAHLPEDGSISVQAVETKYPQGAEKMLIKSLLDLEVPNGGLPSEVGVVVNNVGTLALLGRLLPAGEGLTERVVTVTGPAVKRPGNFWVPLGTPIRHVLQWSGALEVAPDNSIEVVLGGPMMGQALASLDAPVTKGVTGILVYNKATLEAQHTGPVRACIKCGECVQACPMGLNPSMLGMLAAKREYAEMGEQFNLADCFECGCCTWVCPSNIPLVQYFRVAKGVLRSRVQSA